ncbi:MAG: hypothetical protein K9W44_09080 [Candidatus Lokiarchaeota archaeon]|nr:hypothetical protein [Candidatus Harpocratesius repetitus]
MISFSINFEMVFVIHKQSNQIIFYRKNESFPLNVKLLEKVQNMIQNNQIQKGSSLNEIKQFELENKNGIIWTGKFTLIVLILNQNPSSMEKEMLHTYGIRLESRFSSELQNLYSTFLGNIDIFLQDLPTRPNLKKITDEIFHIDFTYPYTVNLNEDIKPISNIDNEILAFATKKVQEQKYVYLHQIISFFEKNHPLLKLQIQESIYSLINIGFLKKIRKK